MSKKTKYLSCGCCIDLTYEFTDNGKGSQYRFGDDDDVPYKKARRKRKKRPAYNLWDENCKKHIYVWVKEIHPPKMWVRGKTPGWGRWVILPGDPNIRYKKKCAGCGKIKRYSWSYVPDEQDIYETVTMDVYGNIT